MFNIDVPYKSATPMKFYSSTKARLKKSTPLFFAFPPLGGQGVCKNYCILRPVLRMQ